MNSQVIPYASAGFAVPGTITATGLMLPPDLTYEQWLVVWNQIALLTKACLWIVGDALNYAEQRYGKMYEAALDATDYDYQTLRIAKHVASKFELFRRRNNLTFSHHLEVAALPADKADELLLLAEEQKLSHKALRALVRTLHISRAPPPVPTGLYNLIYADPPWRYDFAPTDSRQIENQYPTMDVDAICDLSAAGKVPAADDCVLFLWATSPKLREALQVIDAWDFTYRTTAVWDKELIGMGYYFRQQHEVLMVATRGQPGVPDGSARESSVIRERRGQHSAKPIVVYDMLERMYPNAARLEMFQRAPREGWQAWGNQVGPKAA